MDTEIKLIQETEKWQKKLSALAIKPKSEKGKQYLININAYISDSAHFYSQKDYIRAFEAIIWAWAWVEIGKDTGILDY